MCVFLGGVLQSGGERERFVLDLYLSLEKQWVFNPAT